MKGFVVPINLLIRWWMIRRVGYFWSTMLEDCFKYYKGCQECQKFGNIQKSSALVMNPIVKP